MHPALLQSPRESALPLVIGALLIVALLGGGAWLALRAELLAARTVAAAVLASALVACGAWLARHSAGPSAAELEPFGSFLTLGLVAGLASSAALARRAGLPRDVGAEALLAAGVGALLGARLLYVLGARSEGGVLAWLAFQRGGLSGYGAALGAWAGALFALRRAARRGHGQPPSAWLDVAAPGTLLTIAVARLGCYLAGCDFGRPFASPPARWLEPLTRFPEPGPGAMSAAYSTHALAGDLSRDGRFTPPLHPTQLYEALGALCLLALLLTLRTRQRRHGAMFLFAALGYALLRFCSELVRGDVERGLLGRLSVTQLCALLSASLATAWWLRSARATSATTSRR